MTGLMWTKLALAWGVILVVGVGVVATVVTPDSKAAPADPNAETWAYQVPQYTPDEVPIPQVPAVRDHVKGKGGGLPHVRHHRLHAWRYAKRAGVDNGRCDSCRVVRRIWHLLH